MRRDLQIQWREWLAATFQVGAQFAEPFGSDVIEWRDIDATKKFFDDQRPSRRGRTFGEPVPEFACSD